MSPKMMAFILGLCAAVLLLVAVWRSQAKSPQERNLPPEPTRSAQKLGKPKALPQAPVVGEDPGPSKSESKEMDTRVPAPGGNEASIGSSIKKRTEDLIAKLFAAQESGDSNAEIAVMGKFKDLQPEMAAYLLDKYSSESDGAKRRGLLLMVYAAGGESVGTYLKEHLLDPNCTVDSRKELLGILGNPNHEINGLYSYRQFPVSGDLAKKASEEYVRSSMWQDRAGAVRILGSLGTPESKDTVLQMAISDPHVNVRSSAIIALGAIGDKETLKFLEQYPYPADDGTNYLLKGAVSAAIKQLSMKK